MRIFILPLNIEIGSMIYPAFLLFSIVTCKCQKKKWLQKPELGLGESPCSQSIVDVHNHKIFGSCTSYHLIETHMYLTSNCNKFAMVLHSIVSKSV